MKKLINFKVKRVSERCYRCFCDDISNVTAEGTTEWEALSAARKAVRQLSGSDDKGR